MERGGPRASREPSPFGTQRGPPHYRQLQNATLVLNLTIASLAFRGVASWGKRANSKVALQWRVAPSPWPGEFATFPRIVHNSQNPTHASITHHKFPSPSLPPQEFNRQRVPAPLRRLLRIRVLAKVPNQ